MAVWIEEAYDREDEFPAFVLVFDSAAWRDPEIWRFELVAFWPSGNTHPDCWTIRVPIGAPYIEAREKLRRRAAAIGYRKVTLYHRQPPPTPEKIAYIQSVNRELIDAREERKRAQRIHARAALGLHGRSRGPA